MARKKKKSRAKENDGNQGSFSNRPFGVLRTFSGEANEDVSRAEDSDTHTESTKVEEEAPENECDDFEALMNGVDRISDSKQLADKRGEAKAPFSSMNDAELVMRQLDDLVSGKINFDIKDTDEYIEASVHELDKRTVKKLRKGEFAVQDNIDLHGYRKDEARLEVARFIEKAHLNGKRCVLIVHGRGFGSKDNIPILKEKLRAWLTRGVIGKKVLAYTSARPCDGGTGAVYVLLRG